VVAVVAVAAVVALVSAAIPLLFGPDETYTESTGGSGRCFAAPLGTYTDETDWSGQRGTVDPDA